MIVLDTNALVWWATEPKRLSDRARKRIEQEIADGEELVVSSMSVWEMALLVSKGRLKFTVKLEKLLEELEGMPNLRFVPLDNQIGLASVYLPGKLHRDPADRIIIATALQLGAVLVTSDRKIRRYSGVQTLW